MILVSIWRLSVATVSLARSSSDSENLPFRSLIAFPICLSAADFASSTLLWIMLVRVERC